ncbi:MAG: DUF5671 domain-containing protein [Acidimicrobiales bacterium]|nr:DUF5671 domain-containing protein [Acidimicrobiales bacterium]
MWEAGGVRWSVGEVYVVGVVLFWLVVAAIVGVIAYRRSGGQVDIGTMVRRFIEYGFLLALVGITGFGVAGVLAQVVGEIGPDSSAGSETTALWLTFVLVGGASLAGLAAWIRRRFARDRGEEEAGGWSLYVAAAELGSLAGVIVSSIGTLSWLIAGTHFVDYWIAHLIVWYGVWAFHWRLGCRSTQRGTVRKQVHLLLGAAAGTIGLAVSTSFVVGHLLNWAYDGSMPDYIPDYGFGSDAASWDSAVDGARDATPAMLTFAAVWFWYWWRNARSTGHSVARHAFVLVGGVLGGLGAAVAAGSGLLLTVLLWFLTDQDGTSVTEHFDTAPVFLTVCIVGLAVWIYNRSELPENERRSEVERTYDHLASWVGLVAATAGIGVLLGGVILHQVMPNPHGWDEALGEPMSGVITLLTVGGTVWWRNWSRIQHHANEPAELGSPVRRVYLLTVFGSTALVVLGSVLVMVYMVVFGLLEQELGADELAWFRIPLALIGSTVGVAVYHGRVLRDGLRSMPASSRQEVSTHVTLVAGRGGEWVREFSEYAGVEVRLRLRADVADFVQPSARELSDAVRSVEVGELVITVAGDGTFEVVPLKKG